MICINWAWGSHFPPSLDLVILCPGGEISASAALASSSSYMLSCSVRGLALKKLRATADHFGRNIGAPPCMRTNALLGWSLQIHAEPNAENEIAFLLFTLRQLSPVRAPFARVGRRERGLLFHGRQNIRETAKNDLQLILLFLVHITNCHSRLPQKYRGRGISWVKGSVCSVLKLALPPFLPPLECQLQNKTCN